MTTSPAPPRPPLHPSPPGFGGLEFGSVVRCETQRRRRAEYSGGHAGHRAEDDGGHAGRRAEDGDGGRTRHGEWARDGLSMLFLFN